MNKQEWLEWQKKIVFDEYIKPELEENEKKNKFLNKVNQEKEIRKMHVNTITKSIINIGGLNNDP